VCVPNPKEKPIHIGGNLMLSFRDTKAEQPLCEICDDVLFERTLVLLQQARAKQRYPRVFAEINTEVRGCHDEISKRGKLYLWNRALDCARRQ